MKAYSLTLCVLFTSAVSLSSGQQSQTRDVTEAFLHDKINGGIIGQFFGNLNGLVHENKYTDKPGNVKEYIPDLATGAFTDDDTDIEFVYIYHMLNSGQQKLSYDIIYNLWVDYLNDGVYCSNEYARKMMNIGIKPPHTGCIALNPWASFNISGQFLCEQFALIAPGMPQTAARLGTHYTHVAIDGEPSQTTQLYDTMIATAFFEDDFMEVVKAGLAAIDPQSEIHAIVSNVIKWYKTQPDDWRATRLAIKEAYWNGEFGGAGGTNGYRTITAATMAAVLYGEGDLVETIRHAFNFGWDADNTAAMVGTIMGVLKGEKWIRAQGWKIKDAYKNTRRPGLPANLTITEFADMHFEIAKRLILENGGNAIEIDGKPGLRINIEPPANIEALPRPVHRINALRSHWWPIIQAELTGDATQKARAVYVAVCLDLAKQISEQRPEDWQNAAEAFKPHHKPLFDHGMWPWKARVYFNEVINKDNPKAASPFKYGEFNTSALSP